MNAREYEGGRGKNRGWGGGGGRAREKRKERNECVKMFVLRCFFLILCFVKMLQLLFDPNKFKIRDRIFLKSFTFLHKFTAVAASC